MLTYTRVTASFTHTVRDSATTPTGETHTVYTSNFEPSRLPSGRAARAGFCRRGDGLGCRQCNFCRHNSTWNEKPHTRTVARERARRQARKQHPRNIAKLSYPHC